MTTEKEPERTIAELAAAAMKTAQAAQEALGGIDQSKVDPGVWATVYQLVETVGDLAEALMMLAALTRREGHGRS